MVHFRVNAGLEHQVLLKSQVTQLFNYRRAGPGNSNELFNRVQTFIVDEVNMFKSENNLERFIKN